MFSLDIRGGGGVYEKCKLKDLCERANVRPDREKVRRLST